MNTRHHKIIEQEMKNSAAFMIRRPKIAFLLGFILLVWGLLSLFSISKESAPYIPFGIISIHTSYSGTSAVDMDELVTSEIEKKIKNISHIKKYTSSSSSGSSSITIEFETDTDMIKAMSDVRSKVDEAKPFLPADIDTDPFILEIDSSLEPFLTVYLSGKVSPLILRDTAEELKKRLEKVSGIARTNINGGAEREIVVEVDREKMESLGLSLLSINAAIQQSHRDTPLGNFEIDGRNYTLRFEGKYKTTTDIEQIILTDLKQKNVSHFVSIKDVAKVFEREKEEHTITRFAVRDEKSGKMGESQNGIFLSLSRKSGSNILKIEQAALAAAQDFQKNILPADINMNFGLNGADIMRDDFKKVLKSGGQSVAIVLLLIFFFVGLMEGIVAAIVIPVTFLVTIGILALTGSTLNFMTNFSMILALGILVDTAIVIVEGTHHFIRRGFSRKESALLALHEYRGPLIAGTLTTLAVFIPLFTLPGLLGKYLSFIPITVSIVLVVSLLFSLLLLPSYSAIMLAPPKKENEHQKQGKLRVSIDRFIEKVVWQYRRVLEKILSSRFWRKAMIFGVIVLFVSSFFLPIKFEMFPSGDSPSLNITVNLLEGKREKDTLRVVRPIEDFLRKYPEVKNTAVSIHRNTANISVEFLPIIERKEKKMRNAAQLESLFKQEIDRLPAENALVRVRATAKGPPSEFPVAFRIIANNKNDVVAAENITQKMTEILRGIPGTDGVKNDIENIPGEFRFRIRRDRALDLNIDPDSVSLFLRTALRGSTAATITRNGRDIDVVVEGEKKGFATIEDILSLKIPNSTGVQIPLSQITTLSEHDAFAVLKRRDGALSFTVSSLLTKNGNAAEVETEFRKTIWQQYLLGNIDLVDTENGISEWKKKYLKKTIRDDMGFFEKKIIAFVQKSVWSKNITFRGGIKMVSGGENEENGALIFSLLSGLLIAILIMFFLLVLVFDSYKQPFLILTTIIFAQIGVSLGLFLTATPRSLAYMLGIIALSGIVVNDAIIMVDQMNRNRREFLKKEKFGTPKKLLHIVVDSGASRFIPVVLTTLTTSAGIIPLIFVDEFWAGLSYTIVFGLAVASFLTLFLTPILYFATEKKKFVRGEEKNV